MTFRACFYKGTRPGLAGIYNRGVRVQTNSKYSHVEIQFSAGISASSSFEDAGVRFKQIDYTSGDWDFIDLPEWLEPHARRWFDDHDEWEYDLLGNLHFVFLLIRGEARKVFCSEAVAEALGVPAGQGYRFSPGDLYAMLSNPLFTTRQATYVNVTLPTR